MRFGGPQRRCQQSECERHQGRIERRGQQQHFMKSERACERGERRREPSGTATVPAIGEAEDERDRGCPERDLDDLRQEEGACDPIHQRQEVRVEGRKEVRPGPSAKFPPATCCASSVYTADSGPALAWSSGYF